MKQKIYLKKEIIYNQIISSKNDDLIESLKNENEDLHKTLDNLHIENQELEALVEKLNIKIKESDLDYQKLKEEYDIKEQNFAEVISNHKSMIEKLNHDLKLEININLFNCKNIFKFLRFYIFYYFFESCFCFFICRFNEIILQGIINYYFIT